MLLTVTVPEGLTAGDVMSVTAPDGLAYEIIVPRGCRAGDSIEVDLPCDEPAAGNGGGGAPAGAANGGLEAVEIVVPDGLSAGDTFSVEFGAAVFEIECPDGSCGGDAIIVELPRQAPAGDDDGIGQTPTTEAAIEQDQSSSSAQQSDYKFQPGQRVEIYRSGRGDDEVTSSGTIVCGFEGVFDVCYKVRLDNGLFKEAVPEEEISGQVTSDLGDLFGEW